MTSMTVLVPLNPISERNIIVANNQNLSISGVGSITLSTLQNQPPTLPNFYLVPYFSTNLLSVGQLVDNGYSVYFTSSGCMIQDQQTEKVIKTE